MLISAAKTRNVLMPIGGKIGLAIVILLSLLATGCASVPPVIKIGLVGPFEGRSRDIGYDAIYSARLAVREENARADLDDYRVALVALDDFGDPETAQDVARSLVLDPAVVAVIGHWLPETTNAALSVYQEAGLPIVPAGIVPFGESDPALLPSDFLQNYADVTPFDEVAGVYAGAGYDSIGLILKAISEAQKNGSTIDRTSIGDILSDLEHEGITGNVHAFR